MAPSGKPPCTAQPLGSYEKSIQTGRPEVSLRSDAS